MKPLKRQLKLRYSKFNCDRVPPSRTAPPTIVATVVVTPVIVSPV